MYQKISLEELIEIIDEGIVILDKEYDIVLFNKKAKSLSGINIDQIKDEKFQEIFPELNDNNSLMLKVLQGSPSIIDYYQNITNKSKNKSSLLISCYPIIENDKVVASMEIYKDITKIELLSKKLYNLHLEKQKQFNNMPDILKNNTIYRCESIIGNNQYIKKAKETIIAIKNLDTSVMIYGETGVGKELFVQAIHYISDRYKHPFISYNCATFPENLMESILFGSVKGSYTGAEDKKGLFELANNGILFLDEINSMPIALQAKLLRVIQDKRVSRVGDANYKSVNVRVIASMNEEPLNAIQSGRLREDLYYRLNCTEIMIPPLRKRRDDIELLVKYYINMYNIALNKEIETISKEALKILIEYDWPGNVRELKHVIENIMNFKEENEIELRDVEHKIHVMKNYKEKIDNNNNSILTKKSCNVSLKKELEKYEKQIIKYALKLTKRNKAQAAKLLKIPKQTLNNKLIKFNLRQ